MVHVAIVGAYGSAGVAVADELVERRGELSDLELTLIDDGDPGGGLCILRGCMPSKDVLSAGQHRYQARHDDRLEGVPDVDPEAVVTRKDDHVSGFAEHRREHVHELAEREGVELLRETARFVDDRVLAVSDRRIEPDYVVVATGSSPNIPDLPGIDDVPVRTSADVLDATAFPDSGIVLGNGYISLELGPYLSEVGDVDLTVIEHDERPLDAFPDAYGDTLLEIYREQFGIEVLTTTDERRLEPTANGGVRLFAERAGDGGRGDGGEELAVEADELYCFTGRNPTLEGLDLENTRLDPGDGWVGSTMQATDDERVFVVGDANGREPILHVAKEQGFAAAENIVHHARGEDLEPYANVPHHVIFSGLGVYPVARVGHTPATAAESGMDTFVVTREASSDGVFATKDHPEGRATLVIDADNGAVLGYQGVHLHADVMAKTMQVVVEMGLDVREVPDRAYHPTTPEILDGLFREACAELEDRQQCVGPDSRDTAL
ncbi:pyridine nucleotide-disulphide oxidoreductase dimerization region [Haloterrigena turkmenica DSM 5511]|uniref:Pyridine nucleotide-disulphide oxidoreductase dimerization region n=1 Tax=Haloterrigena turkmenica (strain ATCC 51198 / DSM 5511 / JCM 9101 / NCIMB 13204 / VKM B-1734 / 4k) TaxID=543526 RepID=D2RZN8_HALTV|nr:NAD(P)/FAD-dependent oxidoreductase [Haloterrigena turkmenica]ADB62077.1 pyridine nucleotide-disulphide oxidoreductase dimerization region [Haloterrigena turkmenica DSM 5511]